MINDIVRNKQVKFIKGDYIGETGTFKAITGYTDRYGCVCRIYIGGEFLEFTSDFFRFVDLEIQDSWEDDTYNFELE